MDIQEKDVSNAMNLASGYGAKNAATIQLAGMIMMAQAIEDHRVTVGRLADVMDKIADKIGVAGCQVADIRRAIEKAVEIYKHSE